MSTDDTEEVEHVAERESSQVVEGGPGEGGARHHGQVCQGAADPQEDQQGDDKPGDKRPDREHRAPLLSCTFCQERVGKLY